MAATILITGASGYLGSRLVPGRAITEVIAGDCLDEASLVAAMEGVDRVYHLVHSMASGPGFAALDQEAAASVGRARRPATPRWATAAIALAAAATLLPATARAQTASPVRTVPFVDLDRYAGDWFEIARFPNRFQRQCLGDVRATYARRPDGRLDVVNRCRTANGQTEARGVARIVDTQTFARLKVRFAPAWLSWLPIVWGDYWIVGLAPDYSWAVVGDPGRDYLWILARTPRLDEESVAAARAAARASGYDVERLVQTSLAGAGRP